MYVCREVGKFETGWQLEEKKPQMPGQDPKPSAGWKIIFNQKNCLIEMQVLQNHTGKISCIC